MKHNWRTNNVNDHELQLNNDGFGSQLDNIQWTWITVGESTMDMNHSWRIDKGHRSWLENQ